MNGIAKSPSKLADDAGAIMAKRSATVSGSLTSQSPSEATTISQSTSMTNQITEATTEPMGSSDASTICLAPSIVSPNKAAKLKPSNEPKSSDTQNVLSLLNKTFDSPAPLSTRMPCNACDAITREVDRYVRDGTPESGPIKRDQAKKYESIQKISKCAWQVGDIETTSKKENENGSQLVRASEKNIDSPSFKVIDDDQIDPLISSKSVEHHHLTPLPDSVSTTDRAEAADTTRSNHNCSECYLCNHETHSIGCPDKKCNNCRMNRNKSKTSTGHTDRRQSDKCSNAKRSPNYLETSSNHRHCQTKSKDSDVISVECRKVNKKVSRYITGNHDTENVDLKSPVGLKAEGIPSGDGQQQQHSNSNSTSSVPKLPVSLSEWSTSTNSCDTVSSSNESSVMNVSPKQSRRRTDRHSVPHLPTAERWFNAANKNEHKPISTQRTRTNSRYEKFYGSKMATVASDDQTNKLTETGSVITMSDGSMQTKSSGKFSSHHTIIEYAMLIDLSFLRHIKMKTKGGQ